MSTLFPDHTTEYHQNGTYTVQYPEQGMSVTKDVQGNVLEETRDTTVFFQPITITRNGDGEVINVQDRKRQ